TQRRPEVLLHPVPEPGQGGRAPASAGMTKGRRRGDGLRMTRGSGQRVTLPALRQPVHTLRRFGAPLTVARTRWMLGSKRRFVILRDQGRLLPKPGFLAQMSQSAATVHSLLLAERFEIDGPWRPLGQRSGNRTRLTET